MQLDDGSVWVANGSQQVIGRANTEVLELNSVVQGAQRNQLETVQNGDTVLLVDHANATVETIDPATSTVIDNIALPPDQAQVFLAGDRAVIFEAGTGELWIVPLVELERIRRHRAREPQPRQRRRRHRRRPTACCSPTRPRSAQVRRVDATRSDEVDAQLGPRPRRRLAQRTRSPPSATAGRCSMPAPASCTSTAAPSTSTDQIDADRRTEAAAARSGLGAAC